MKKNQNMRKIRIIKKIDPGCCPVYSIKVQDISSFSKFYFWYLTVITLTYFFWDYLFESKKYTRTVFTTINEAEVYRFCSLIIRIRKKRREVKALEKSYKTPTQTNKTTKVTYYSVQEIVNSLPLKSHYLNSLTGPKQSFRDLKLRGY